MRCRRTQRLSETGISTVQARPLGTMWWTSAFCGRAGRSSLPIGRSLSARTMRHFRHSGISLTVASGQLRTMPRTKSALSAFQCLPFQNKADCGGLTAKTASASSHGRTSSSVATQTAPSTRRSFFLPMAISSRAQTMSRLSAAASTPTIGMMTESPTTKTPTPLSAMVTSSVQRTSFPLVQIQTPIAPLASSLLAQTLS